MRLQLPAYQVGIYLGFSAYFIWGLTPLYFKAMAFIDSAEIVAHRILWTAVITLLLAGSRPQRLLALVRQRKTLFVLLVTSALITSNWLLFIWAVHNNHVLEASLGYFINPLITLVLSMVFFGERFRRLQWFAIGLVVLAILIPLWRYGEVPWISLGLASSFACYGLVRKKINVAALPGLCIETVLALPLAAYLLIASDSPTTVLWHNPLWLNLALSAGGVVTMLPLLCYAAAATRIKLSTLGMMQYIVPSMLFMLAIVVFGEKIREERFITFVLIWLALALYSFDSLHHRKHPKTPPNPM